MIAHRVVPFELKSAAADGSTGEGYASVFHVVDSYGEIVHPNAFDGAIADFLDVGFVGNINHDWQNPVGRPTSAKTDARGLFVSWKLSDTSAAQDVRKLLKDGVIKRLSIGYRTAGAQEMDHEETQDYWRSFGYRPTDEDMARAQHGTLLLTKIRPLFEFSPVTVPANTEAVITSVKSANTVEAFERGSFEKWLRSEYKMSRGQASHFTAQARAVGRGVAGMDPAVSTIREKNQEAILRKAREDFEESGRRMRLWGIGAVVLSPADQAKVDMAQDTVTRLHVAELNHKTKVATAQFLQSGCRPASPGLSTDIRSVISMDELQRKTIEATEQYRRRFRPTR